MGLEETFAYDSFRPGQEALAKRVHDACANGETLLAEAMSGFGKTAAILTGTLAAAEETGLRVVYACRTKRQIARVMSEVSALQAKHKFEAASISSKFDYCLLKRDRQIPKASFGWYCGFNVSNNLCSYFLNVPLLGESFDSVVNGTLSRSPSHAELLERSVSLHVCPYEVARTAMAKASFAVAPYPYVFDWKSSSVLFDRDSPERQKTILVVDEAHNLRDFFRDAGSAVLTLGQIKGAAGEARSLLMDDAAASLDSLCSGIEKEMLGNSGWLLDKESLMRSIGATQGPRGLQNLAFELSACAGPAWGAVAYERRMPSQILKVGDFLTRLTSQQCTTLVKWDGALAIVEPNPVAGLAGLLKEFAASILVSATISPSGPFIRSLGLAPRAVSCYSVSEKPLVEVGVAIDLGVSTRYSLRTPAMLSKIAERIVAVINETSGGVGVFTPSYSLLESISKMVAAKVGKRNLVFDAPGLPWNQAAEVFDSFCSTEGSVLLAVQGGRFSEGEDFNRGTMDSVVVVGLSLPPPSPLLYAEYSFLKRSGEQDSFLILSRLPALRKALQAAGRHVRNPGKRGLVFLQDWRFGDPAVIELMPSWLRANIVADDFNPRRISSFSQSFWSHQVSQPSPS